MINIVVFIVLNAIFTIQKNSPNIKPRHFFKRQEFIKEPINSASYSSSLSADSPLDSSSYDEVDVSSRSDVDDFEWDPMSDSQSDKINGEFSDTNDRHPQISAKSYSSLGENENTLPPAYRRNKNNLKNMKQSYISLLGENDDTLPPDYRGSKKDSEFDPSKSEGLFDEPPLQEDDLNPESFISDIKIKNPDDSLSKIIPSTNIDNEIIVDPTVCPHYKNVGNSYNYKGIFTIKKQWTDNFLDKSSADYQQVKDELHLLTLMTYVDDKSFIDILLVQVDNIINKTKATAILRFVKKDRNADSLWRSIKCCFTDCEFFDDTDFDITPITDNNVAELCVGICVNAYMTFPTDICSATCPIQCCNMENFIYNNQYLNGPLNYDATSLNNQMCPASCTYNCNAFCSPSCCNSLGFKRNTLYTNGVLNKKNIKPAFS